MHAWITQGCSLPVRAHDRPCLSCILNKPSLAWPALQVDFGVVVISTLVLIAETMDARFLKALRVLRAIKPLR